MVKPGGGQRGSDGAVVPPTGAQHSAPGGKGPDFGRAGRGVARQGMAGTARPIPPGGRQPVEPHRLPPVDKVRQLRRQPWAAAKRSPGRRLHALADRIHRGDVLREAWRRVRSNGGAAGADGVALADIEAYGAQRMLDGLAADPRDGTYRPAPVRRRLIPKPDGGARPLGIPTVRDRVAQQAAKLVLEPVFEAGSLPSSYGLRPRRTATMALEAIRTHYPQGYRWVAETDVRSFFDRIDHGVVLRLVGRRVSDRRVLRLARPWLEAGVMADGRVGEAVAGAPQGGVISPLLANVVLHELDRRWGAGADGVLVRYADDLVVLCRSRSQAEAALVRVGDLLSGPGLETHPDKTGVVGLDEGRQGFDFLGCHLHARVSGPLLERGIRRRHLHRWPSQRSRRRLRARVRALAVRSRCHADIREVIAQLSPVLRGWGGYFRTGNAARVLSSMDRYVADRLRGLLAKRHGRHLRPSRSRAWTRAWFEGHGLHRLRGTVRYPGAA